MCQVLFQQFPYFRYRFFLNAPLVILLVALEGLTGVQGKDLQRGLGAEQHRQGADAAADHLRREDREVVRANQVKNTLTGFRLDAVGRDLHNAHELPGGLALAQLFFLLAVHHGSSLHS